MPAACVPACASIVPEGTAVGLTMTLCTACLIVALLLLCSDPSGNPRDFSTARRTCGFFLSHPERHQQRRRGLGGSDYDCWVVSKNQARLATMREIGTPACARSVTRRTKQYIG